MPQFQNPGIPNVVSEYGSRISDRPGDYDGQFNTVELNDNTPEYPWRSGQSLWCAFDYSTIFGHFGCMGFVDYFRIPKRPRYWYRNQYLHIPPPEWPQNGTPAKLSLTADKTMIQGTYATDDCQLLVTVQDANGKSISNSPPVTFTIESGPGEFPTGRSITFNPPSNDPKSDIAIRDGQAAIEFRSYYGGQSVIRATSPGLKDATLTITTVGDPQFVPGQTPVAPDRPYVRFDKSALPATGSQNIALDHPASASSEAPGHTARLANDGDMNTSWQAADGDVNPWWQVNLEGLYSIHSVETTFSKTGNYQYKIEASPDGKSWTLLTNQTRTNSTNSSNKTRTDTCAKNDRNRYLRLSLTEHSVGHAPQVEEIKIVGKPSDLELHRIQPGGLLR